MDGRPERDAGRGDLPCGGVLANAVGRAAELVSVVVGEGSLALDATAGNGHDTLLLARAVGAGGRVFAVDIRPDALAETRRRLTGAGLGERVTLIEGCHSRLGALLPEAARGRIRAAMFNLGYLPGSGEKDFVTRSAATIPALDAALGLLAPGGLLTVVMYSGHAGGAEEVEAVLAWAAGLEQKRYTAMMYGALNQRNAPPTLLAVERRA